MQFAWDETKNRQNRTKHGIWFEEAQSVFADVQARVFADDEHSGEEERLVILGMSASLRVLIVVHCFRKDDQIVRIISARKATKKERVTYEEGI